MTLPSNTIFPLINDFKNIEDINQYLRDLVFSIQQRDEQIAQRVNGNIRANAFTQKENWTPILKGTIEEGSFAYTHQIGWALRQGLIIDVWFDVLWTNQINAKGGLYLELPYQVALSSQTPFVGTLQTEMQSNLTINAIPNTYRGEIWSTKTKIEVATTGQLIGHIRYIGVSDER